MITTSASAGSRVGVGGEFESDEDERPRSPESLRPCEMGGITGSRNETLVKRLGEKSCSL